MAIDKTAFYNLTYGLFLLTAKEGDRDNGCIVNTAIQAASDPKLISVCCIKGNYTQEMIDRTGQFNVSVLTESKEFGFFKHFGMQSGRDVDKFGDEEAINIARAANGLVYDADANAVFSCKVVSKQDLGSHMLYIATVEEAIKLSDEPSITYAYYQGVTKKAQPAPTGVKKGWRCKVCGYIYEGEVLPADFVCPICKHGADDFEPIDIDAA